VDVIECGCGSLQLRQTVVVDVELIAAWAARLIDGRPTCEDLSEVVWRIDSLQHTLELDDDWAIVDRERLRQRLLHAIEALSRYLIHRGRCA
jgi:hypothetical protein